MPGASGDQRAAQLKALLVKFRKSQNLTESSEDLDDFVMLLDLNS
jgi:hypothetical protein